MTVKISIEGPGDEVDAALAIIGKVIGLGRSERRKWDIPVPTEQVIVDATVPQGNSE